MKEQKLISMVEFVLNAKKHMSRENNPNLQFEKLLTKRGILIESIFNYANFLSQPLTLGMFVPCVNGEVIKEPKKKYKGGQTVVFSTNQFTKEYSDYLKAKERVLFEGCRIVDGDMIFIKGHDTDLFVDELSEMIIDDLLKMTIQTDWILTKNAIKTIYG